MKKGQNVIVLTFKDSGDSYLFGSLSAVCAMFDDSQLGVNYKSLRNAVSRYGKNRPDEDDDARLQTIYDHPHSLIKIQRAPMLLADKESL